MTVKQDSPQSPQGVDRDAANERVTAQELTHAVASIEARREKLAHEAANTIALGEAVQQLEIRASPQELLEEVNALRARQAGVARVTQRKRAHGRRAGAVTLWLGGIVILALGIQISDLNRELDIARQSNVSAAPEPAKTETPPAPTFERLSEAPDGQAFYCDSSVLKDIAMGRPQEHVTVLAPSRQDNDLTARGMWTLIKTHGRPQVVAWGSVETAIRAENGHSATFYSAPADPGDTGTDRVRRMIPVERFIDAETTPGSVTTISSLTIHTVPPVAGGPPLPRSR